MHIIIKDPETGETLAILCIERSIHSCQIIHADMDHMTEILGVALGMKVNEVRIIVPQQVVAEMIELGWEVATESVAMVKRNGK